MRSPYKAGDIIAQDIWYNASVGNVGLVIADEADAVCLVLWKKPDLYHGSRLLWTIMDQHAWDGVPHPKAICQATYLVHRPRK